MHYDSNIDPIGLGSIREQEQTLIRCEIDGYGYPVSEMAFDKDGNTWVHKSNINEYLEGFKRDMLWPDFEALRDNLLKQIK